MSDEMMYLYPDDRLTVRDDAGIVHCQGDMQEITERLCQYEDTKAAPRRVEYMMGLSMPKLPRPYWMHVDRHWNYFCDNCGHPVHKDVGDYCPNCGQHIDWRIWCHEKEYGGVKK